MELYDCHCHLHDAAFDADRDAVIDRARARGVRRVLSVAEDLEDAWRLLSLSERSDGFLLPALGVHPDRAPGLGDSEVGEVIALIERFAPRLGAVAEIGLDFRPCWDEKARDRQREVFRAMIAVGGRLKLPLSIHSRSAGHHAIDELEKAGAESVVLHAFDGRAVHGERGASLGYSFSIPPSIVRSVVIEKLVRRLPLRSLLLESDSPVLGPLAEERNEPANLRVGLARIAAILDLSEVDLSERIGENTRELFPRLVGDLREKRGETRSP